MKRRNACFLAAIACGFLTLSGVAFVQSGHAAAASFVPSSNTYVHYLGREATKGQNGIREYWIRCGGSYQFSAPTSGTIVEGGAIPDTSGFTADDPRWIFSVTLDTPQYINVCDSYSKKVDFLDDDLNSSMTAVSVHADVGGIEYDLKNAGRYLANPMPSGLQNDKAHHGANEIVFDGTSNGKYYRYYIPVIFVTANISSGNLSDVLAAVKTDGTNDIYGYYTLGMDTRQANLAQGEKTYFDSMIASTASSPAFRGTLDGMGHKLTIYRSYVYSCGLFGTMSGATVKNLNVAVNDVIYPWDGANLLACNAFDSTFENIDFTLQKAYSTSWVYNAGRGALLGATVDHCSFRNVNLTLKDETNSLIFLYGSNLKTNNTFETCSVKIPFSTQMTAIAYRGGSPLSDQDIEGLTLTSVLDADYKDERDAARAFSTASFGTRKAFGSNPYGTPSETPEASSHPRVLVNQASLETLREKVNNPVSGREDYFSTSEYKRLAEEDITGELEGTGNWDKGKTLGIIEAKAFSYLMTGQKAVGYRAIRCLKNLLLTMDFTNIDYDSCRAYGQVMHVGAEVYDWCYDLLNADDRAQIVAGITSLCGPRMEMVASTSDITPTKQSPFNSHGAEGQLLRDWLSFSIAVYDEYPEYFHFVGGRLATEFRPGTATLLGDSLHWEGSSYGHYRMFFLLVAQKLYKAMNSSSYALFSDEQLEQACVLMLGHLRPDGQSYRDGDDYNEKGSSYGVDALAKNCFLAGNEFSNPVLKGYAYDHKRFAASTNYSYSDNSLTPTLYLLTNNTSIGRTSLSTLSPITYSGDAQGYLTAQAKSPSSQRYDIGVSLDMAENFTGGHQHLDAGSFQIYYKGMLATDSGYYDSWGSTHWYSYAMQTVAHNSLLVYNPSHTNQGKYVYSGGQRIDQNFVNPTLLTASNVSSAAGVGAGKVTGRYSSLDDRGYNAVYLSGDLTGYYDSDTVDEVSRSIVSVTTGDSAHPMITMVYDRITSDSASYKKTFLLHTQAEPSVSSSLASVSNGSGKLTVQSFGDSVSVSKVSGCSVNGTVVAPTGTVGSAAEVGWGRLELSPSTSSKTNRLLTGMYVGDESDNTAVSGTKVSGTNVVGATLLQNTFLFPKESNSFDSGATITVSGSGATTYNVAGLKGGQYHIENGTVSKDATVVDGENFLRFEGVCGQLVITKTA